MLPEEKVVVVVAVVPVVVVVEVVMVVLAAAVWQTEPVAVRYQPFQFAVLLPCPVSGPRVLLEAC